MAVEAVGVFSVTFVTCASSSPFVTNSGCGLAPSLPARTVTGQACHLSMAPQAPLPALSRSTLLEIRLLMH